MPFLDRTLRSAAFVCLNAVLTLLSMSLFSVAGYAMPADNAPTGPNSDPTYQALRNLTLSGESVSVTNLDLKRDAGTFHLHSGTVCFVAPVNGKVTGAVFSGDGNFVLDPPLGVERKSLNLLTKQSEFSERFEQLVLRFTDSTYDEIKKAGAPATGACDAGPLKDSQHTMRHKLKDNLDARILQDILGTQPGGLFVAFVHGKNYNGQELYVIDPHGVHIGFPVAPEEVEFMTYDENKYGCWAAFHLSQEYKDGTASGNQNNWWAAIDHQELDTQIEKNGNLTGKAVTSFSAASNGVRVVPFNLFHTLRVQSVTGGNGQPLAFIQEDKNDDAQFFVILPQPLAAGEKFTITTVYGGKEAVTNEGGDNYYPVARVNWYPNSGDNTFGNHATYDMKFHVPKGMKMAVTGTPTENNEKEGTSHWVSEAPQVVAGFNFGRFKVEEAKLTKPEYLVQSYANVDPPSWVRGAQQAANSDLPIEGGSHIGEEGVALGTMNTTVLNKKALAESELAVQIYTDYFGPSLFKQLEVTQQTADDYGQAWPGLVYLPITYFFDTTTRHSLINMIRHRCPSCFMHGDDPYGYFKVVAPHEVAHQWWGHTVSWGSYRDQWMSEGFADASASIYLQAVYSKEPQKVAAFWHDELQILTERNKDGFRAIDVGPLTMGYRLNNSRAGFDITRDLIYPKGAYVLHMIRMMMRDRQKGDQPFKEAMQDFVKTYAGKAATTEDFKAMIEKHMTPEMDLEGNHKMDWFFNEYVYGTQLPTYKLDSSFDIGADGDVILNLKVTESGVDDKFRMLVPVYLELAEGNIAFLGRARLSGNNFLEQKIPLKGLKTKPRRAVLNYYADVLASPN
ncbi:MAG TPA: M1 family aminopeptidase [Candidatus Dormibacteraeota bacterium]|nr:M1 family aminopeptidase [Candidatus Dormibacteraeota bacterium]